MLEEDIPAMSRDGISSRSQLRSVPPTNKSQARERDCITDTCIRNDSDWHVGYTTKDILYTSVGMDCSMEGWFGDITGRSGR